MNWQVMSTLSVSDVRDARVGRLRDELDLARVVEDRLGEEMAHVDVVADESAARSLKCQGGLVLPVPTRSLPRARMSSSLPASAEDAQQSSGSARLPRWPSMPGAADPGREAGLGGTGDKESGNGKRVDWVDVAKGILHHAWW